MGLEILVAPAKTKGRIPSKLSIQSFVDCIPPQPACCLPQLDYLTLHIPSCTHPYIHTSIHTHIHPPIHTHRLPIERQLEVVDMDNEDMDMLEWIVRKTIPIPKQYYWETGNTDLPRNVKVWHNVVGSLSGAVKWLDRVGKPVVDATGLTASRFDYVESTMTDKQKEIAIQTASARRLNCPNNNNKNKTSSRSSLSYPDKDGAFA